MECCGFHDLCVLPSTCRQEFSRIVLSQPLWERRFSLQKEHVCSALSVETRRRLIRPESRTSQGLMPEKRAGFQAPLERSGPAQTRQHWSLTGRLSVGSETRAGFWQTRAPAQPTPWCSGPRAARSPLWPHASLQGASRTFFPGVVEMLSVFAHGWQ